MYKGFYLNPKAAAKGKTYISYVPSSDGKIYEVRNTEMGIISTPAKEIAVEGIENVEAGFCFKLPKIPFMLIDQIIAFFRYFNNQNGGVEALVQLYWDRVLKEYFIYVPKQTVNKVRVTTDEEPLNNSQYLLVADIHSHNSMRAIFSSQDDEDDVATRIYVVIGRLNEAMPEISIRVSNGGKYLPLKLQEIFEIKEAFPAEWIEKVVCQEMTEDEKEEAEKEILAEIYENYCLSKRGEKI